MLVKQIYELTNETVKEILGEETVVQEDLSNLVEIGESVFNADAKENYVHSLVDHIGKMVFVVRKYAGSAPSVLMDSWEYGSVLEKVHVGLPEAQENESWELEDGASYDENVFKAPQVTAKFYNNRTTFEVQISITDKQLKSAFSSPSQMNSFIDMIYNKVDQALTVRTDALVMRTINNFIGSTLANDIPDADYGDKTTARCVNLLKLYNAEHADAPLTASTCIRNKDFIRFSALMMKMYATRLSKMSKIFNIGGTDKFTTRDFLKVVLHTEFKSGADVYLQSDTWHNEFTKLPQADEIAYWQGSGETFAFEDTSKINIKTASGDEVELSGILGVMFDRDALGVSCYERHVTSKYNARAEFTNLWYKQFAGYFNDFNENFVVFYVADAKTE